MLLNYRFTNFNSFRENVDFSLVAPKGKVKKRFPGNYVETDVAGDILKTAVIVGENTGGKSNFVRSIDYFKHFFWSESVYAMRNTVNINSLQVQKTKNTLQKFEIEVYISENGIFSYQLEIDHIGIVREELYVRKKASSKNVKLFSLKRKSSEVINNENKVAEENPYNTKSNYKNTFELDLKGYNDEFAKRLINGYMDNKQSSLFVMRLAIIGDTNAVSFTNWIKNNLIGISELNIEIAKTYNPEKKDIRILNDSRFFEIFKIVDSSIKEIIIDSEQPYLKSEVVRVLSNGEKYIKPLNEESKGLISFFSWAINIFQVVYEDKTVFVDELDSFLNPVLADRILSFVQGSEHKGQFIFTTHNVMHLDLKYMMKEQIYFITKDIKTLESELYSLADFPEVRYETTEVYKLYLKGLLGGAGVE